MQQLNCFCIINIISLQVAYIVCSKETVDQISKDVSALFVVREKQQRKEATQFAAEAYKTFLQCLDLKKDQPLYLLEEVQH